MVKPSAPPSNGEFVESHRSVAGIQPVPLERRRCPSVSNDDELSGGRSVGEAIVEWCHASTGVFGRPGLGQAAVLFLLMALTARMTRNATSAVPTR